MVYWVNRRLLIKNLARSVLITMILNYPSKLQNFKPSRLSLEVRVAKILNLNF